MNIYNLAFLLLLQFHIVSPLKKCQQKLNKNKSVVTNIVFKSINGGQTWQDISEGLPTPVKDNYGIGRNIFFADNNGLYLTAENGIYHSKPYSTTSFWDKDIFPDVHSSITPGNTGIFAYNYHGGILQKTNGTSVWSPIFTNFEVKQIRTVFETAGGTVFIGSDKGLFKTINSGKTWKHVHAGGWVMNLVESNGVLLATSISGIIRSTDDGENWALVISEGGVGIAVAPIRGGFAAITFNTQSNSRRVRTSYDDGKTWQPIDAGLHKKASIVPWNKPLFQVNVSDSVWHPINTNLPEQAFITSIVEVGKYFFCGHPAGIFRSSDKGKTWILILPSIKNKVFNLCVSGNVIYAIPRDAGC